jgi:hypothetical protein
MATSHAVIWLDHHAARVLQFDDTKFDAHKIREHVHPTARHGSEVRSQHEFFGEVCDAMEGVPEILVSGGHTPITDFAHYVGKHRPAVSARVVGYEIVDHPSDKQLVALARTFFAQRDALAGSAATR